MKPSDVEGLKKQVRGELLQPSDTAYDEVRSIFNAVIDRRPDVIVRPAGTEDVAAAVSFAREQDLSLSIRGGGHSVSGNAVCDGGVMLDMSKMKGVQVDARNRVATADAGLTLGDYDKATTAQNISSCNLGPAASSRGCSVVPPR